jgi:DNA-directed RNA polymerase specialized sigma24 family protein
MKPTQRDIPAAHAAAKEWKAIQEDYTFDTSIFNDEPDRVRGAKAALAALPPAERTVFIIYAETGSFRKLGNILGISHNCARNTIISIRRKILENLASL